MAEQPGWLEGLSHKDWLFDGASIRSDRMMDRFRHLDWNKAWVDLGPSIAGNPGPYWHVPLHYEHDDTVHRLYPKVLMTKWLCLIRRACEEVEARCNSGRLIAANKELTIELASARIRIIELEKLLNIQQHRETTDG